MLRTSESLPFPLSKFILGVNCLHSKEPQFTQACLIPVPPWDEDEEDILPPLLEEELETQNIA